MSRNNKNARLHAEDRAWAAVRKGGGKGPAQTEPKHGKKNVKWASKEVIAARAAIANKTEEKTVLEQLKGAE